VYVRAAAAAAAEKGDDKTDPSCCLFHTLPTEKPPSPITLCVCVRRAEDSAIKRKKEFFFFKKIFSLREQIRKPNGEPTVCPFGLEIVCNFH
jgi:hypothetical protein